MTKVEKIKSFNEILETFLQQLSPIVGTTYHYYFKQLIKVNSTMPIKTFLVEVSPYKEKIFNKDESYFLNIEDKNISCTSFILIKEPWPSSYCLATICISIATDLESLLRVRSHKLL